MDSSLKLQLDSMLNEHALDYCVDLAVKGGYKRFSDFDKIDPSILDYINKRGLRGEFALELDKMEPESKPEPSKTKVKISYSHTEPHKQTPMDKETKKVRTILLVETKKYIKDNGMPADDCSIHFYATKLLEHLTCIGVPNLGKEGNNAESRRYYVARKICFTVAEMMTGSKNYSIDLGKSLKEIIENRIEKSENVIPVTKPKVIPIESTLEELYK